MSRSILLAFMVVPVLLFCAGCPFIEVSATASVDADQSTTVDDDQSTEVNIGWPCVPPCEPKPEPPKEPDPDCTVICSNEGLVVESLSNGDIRVTYPGGFGGGNTYLRITAGANQLIEIMSWDSAQAEVVFTPPPGESGGVTVVVDNGGPTVHCTF